MDKHSVYQWFADDSCEKVAEFVPAEKAAQIFASLTTSVGARIGTTKRVIITDSDDFTNAEWIYGQGITYPPAEEKSSEQQG